MTEIFAPGENDPLTNMELVEYGNFIYEVDWEGTSLNMVREKIESEGIIPATARYNLDVAKEAVLLCL